MTRARKAIAAFKVRKGNAVGVMVTLRRARMYEFLDRLMNVALPRVRDFKGVNKSLSTAVELLAGNSRTDHLP